MKLWLFSIQIHANVVSWRSRLHSGSNSKELTEESWPEQPRPACQKGRRLAGITGSSSPTACQCPHPPLPQPTVQGDGNCSEQRRHKSLGGLVAMRDRHSSLECWQTLQRSKHQDLILNFCISPAAPCRTSPTPTITARKAYFIYLHLHVPTAYAI